MLFCPTREKGSFKQRFFLLKPVWRTLVSQLRRTLKFRKHPTALALEASRTSERCQVGAEEPCGSGQREIGAQHEDKTETLRMHGWFALVTSLGSEHREGLRFCEFL